MEETRATMTKDLEVEVCTEEEGFEGAWFRAILEEDLTDSVHRKVRVRYTTLLTDDGLSLLTETVDKKLIRPVPPENLYSGVVLEEGMLVDADHRDAFWTGVVIKKKVEEDIDYYLVSFDSPPDILQFKRNLLRAHLHWTGSEWVQPDIQELDKSEFCSGTMVEVSSVHKGEVTWFPAMIVKEIEEDDGDGGVKKFIVKDCRKHMSYNGEEARPNTTVDTCRVRPTPPPFSVKQYDLMERVEAFHGSGWLEGLVRKILSEKRYKVCLEATKEEFEFKHSDLRPLKVWEDGVWHNGPKQKPLKETHTNVIQTKPTRSSSGAKPMTHKRHRRQMRVSEENGETATGEVGKKKVDAMMIDKTLMVVTPQVTPIARGSVSPVTPSPVMTAMPPKQTDTETKGKKSSENGLGNASTPNKLPEEERSEDKSRKRKKKEKQLSDLNETDKTCNGAEPDVNKTSKKICNDDDVDDQPLSAWIQNISTDRSSDQSSNVMMNSAAAVEETPAKETVTALHFGKESLYWKTYESLEVFKSIPQSPHFSPLLEYKDNIREWAAVGMMVNYYRLLEEVKDLKPDDSTTVFEKLSVSFAELEKHGFEVVDPQSRIKKVLSIKDEIAKKAEERKCFEKKMLEVEREKRKVEEEMVELKKKIFEMQRRDEVAVEEKKAAEKRMVELKSNAESIELDIADAEVEFKDTLSAPW